MAERRFTSLKRLERSNHDEKHVDGVEEPNMPVPSWLHNQRDNLHKKTFRTRLTTTSNRICTVGAPSPLDFLTFSPVDFSFSPDFLSFRKEIAPEGGEDCPISGRMKKRRILSCLWLSWLFRSRKRLCILNWFLGCFPKVPTTDGLCLNLRKLVTKTMRILW